MREIVIDTETTGLDPLNGARRKHPGTPPWTSSNRYLIHGTGKWVDDHLSREPIVVFVAEIVISPADHPDGLLSKLVRYGLDQCTGFSCREAGHAELNQLLIRFI